MARRPRDRDSAWTKALEPLRLDLEREYPPCWTGLTDAGPLVVTLDDAEEAPRYALKLPIADAWRGLMVMARRQAAPTSGAVTTGDAPFDEAVLVVGADVLGLFDADTRAAVFTLVERGVIIAQGAIHLGAGPAGRLAPELVAPTLAAMIALASQLAASDTTAARARAATIALDDADPEVRRVFAAHAGSAALEALATQRAIARAPGSDNSLETLAGIAGDAKLLIEHRLHAVKKLFGSCDLAEVVALAPKTWRLLGFAEYEGALQRALKSAPLDAAGGKAVLDFVWREVAGEASSLSPSLAHGLLELLLEQPADAGWLTQLALHRDLKVMKRACDQLAARVSLAELASACERVRAVGRSLGVGTAALMIDRLLAELAQPQLALEAFERCLSLLRMAPPKALDAPRAKTLRERLAIWRGEPALALVCTLLEERDAQLADAALVALLSGAATAFDRLALIPATSLDKVVARAPLVAGDADARHAAPLLAELMRKVHGGDVDLRLRYLTVLHDVGGPDEVEAVAGALESDVLRHQAIATLGAIGDARAIATLTPYAGGFFRSGDTKARARAAIDAIRARVGDGKGALSLSEEGGGLAVSEGRD